MKTLIQFLFSFLVLTSTARAAIQDQAFSVIKEAATLETMLTLNSSNEINAILKKHSNGILVHWNYTNQECFKNLATRPAFLAKVALGRELESAKVYLSGGNAFQTVYLMLAFSDKSYLTFGCDTE